MNYRPIAAAVFVMTLMWAVSEAINSPRFIVTCYDKTEGGSTVYMETLYGWNIGGSHVTRGARCEVTPVPRPTPTEESK